MMRVRPEETIQTTKVISITQTHAGSARRLHEEAKKEISEHQKQRRMMKLREE